ncbi:MAG: hypothetical protein GY799_09535, partial [Desulfobulbaceae bacterium]|nr:hypothetical protein [Desulfobulbaceae bacterium]
MNSKITCKYFLNIIILLFASVFTGCDGVPGNAPAGNHILGISPCYKTDGLQRPECTYRFQRETNTESYSTIVENRFKAVTDAPLSTFSIDVDTASYSNMRRFLRNSQMPPVDSVRIEEMINYFPYDYSTPVDGKPFAVNAEVCQCPWENKHQLMRIGIKGMEMPA